MDDDRNEVPVHNYVRGKNVCRGSSLTRQQADRCGTVTCTLYDRRCNLPLAPTFKEYKPYGISDSSVSSLVSSVSNTLLYSLQHA